MALLSCLGLRGCLISTVPSGRVIVTGPAFVYEPLPLGMCGLRFRRCLFLRRSFFIALLAFCFRARLS